MAKLRKNQKVYRVKFFVIADILCEQDEFGAEGMEDRASDVGYDTEYSIENVLESAGFQNAQASVDSVTPAPAHAQVRRRGERGV